MPRKFSGLWKDGWAYGGRDEPVTHHAQDAIWALEADHQHPLGTGAHHAQDAIWALEVERRCRSLTAYLDNHAQDTTWALKSEWRSRLANVKGCIIMSGLSRALKVPEVSYPQGAEDR